MYDNWLFLTLFLFPLKKRGKKKKENEVAKPVLNHFLKGHNRFSPPFQSNLINIFLERNIIKDVLVHYNYYPSYTVEFRGSYRF